MKILIYLFSSCIYAIAIIKYMNYLLQYRAKNKWAIWLIAIIHVCITTTIYFSETVPIINAVLLFGSIISFGCFFSNWKKVTVVSSFLLIAQCISEIMTFYLLTLISSSSIVSLEEDTASEIGMVASKMVMPIILYIFAKMFRLVFSKEPIPAKYLFGCISIPFLSIAIFNYIYLSNMENNMPIYHSLGASIVVMIMNILILLIFIRLTEYYDAKIKNQQYVEQIDAFNNQQLNNVNAITAIKQVRHDLNNILLAIKINLENHNIGDALYTINHHFQEANPAYFVSNTGIYHIDSIINYKNETARQTGIHVIVLSQQLEEIKINWPDVCVIMSSALDNSIEACNRIESNSEKFIRITIGTHNQMLRVSISNPYTGKIKLNSIGGYMSVKTDKENHGYGVSGIMRLLEKNDGFGEINNNNNIFDLTFIIPEKQ